MRAGILTERRGCGSPVVKVSDHGRHVMRSSPEPLKTRRRAVGSLVVRASDSRPEGLGSMLDVTKYPPSAHGFTCRNCGGGDRGRVAIYRPFGEVSLSLNRTVTCMVLKANDRRTSCPCHDEFRGPRSDYVRQDTGCLCKNKSPGRKETKPEVVERIRDSFLRSPSKLTRRAGAELAVPHTTVWRVSRKRLQFTPYRYQMVQALKPTDKPLCKDLYVKFQENLDVNGSENTLVFTDEATFHLCGKVKRHNLRFCGTEKVHVTVEHQRDSPKVNGFDMSSLATEITRSNTL
ncbi:uncharacterized protein TNCV_648411 [Trichonephila clavipes]|uniref:Transposase Tc1-like domain-containing protein n=1 Tax=Trichonephila clavipes TaxID=2585209 RepID=A0A8X6VND5_TRICX|nr:uncharacterized protein TNCV_648411 [Trichonephila clavipes]